MYGSLWTAADEKLGKTVPSTGRPPSRFSLGHLIAWVLAAVVLVVEFCIPILGIYAIVRLGVGIGPILIAAFCLFMFWVTRPRVLARGAPDQRGEVPGLRPLVDPVAEAMRVRVSRVCLTSGFGASVRREGITRRPAMYLGVPLLASLRDEERVALVAHECGDLVDHDPTDGLVVRAAFDTLSNWFQVLGQQLVDAPPGVNRYATAPKRAAATLGQGLASLLLRLAALPVRGYGFVMLSPLSFSSRRADLYADSFASETAGTPAMTAMLQNLEPMNGVYTFLLELAVLHPERRGRMAEQLAERRAALDAGERPPTQSVRSVFVRSHPPIDVRIAALANRNDPARVRVSAADVRDLDGFLAMKLSDVERSEVSRSAMV
jgi:Zn-dependent protease with chaperone function